MRFGKANIYSRITHVIKFQNITDVYYVDIMSSIYVLMFYILTILMERSRIILSESYYFMMGEL